MPPLASPVSSADLRSHNGQLPAAPAPDGQGHAGRGLSLKIGIERNAYVAGQQIKGVIELSVRDKRIALGEVGVEFTAHEQLRSRDHTSTRRLLSTRLDFQGNGLPPSNAVVPGSRPIQSAFYPALPGRTRFAFVFNVPANMPSSCSLGSNATTRYELRAFASSLLEGNIDIRSEKMEVQVVERWADWREGPWQKGSERKAAEKLAMGGDGQLELTAQLGVGDWAEKPARLFWRGDHDMEVSGKTKIEVNARVRNLSKRHVTGFKLSLHRRLRVLYPEGSRPLVEPPVVSTVIATERFHGIDYDVRSQGERDVILPMSVPPDECWTVRKGTLFELDIVLRVEVECGFLQKPLTVDMPVWVAHPLSLPNSAHRFAADERARIAPAPLSAPSQPSIPYSPSTVGVSSPGSYNALSPEPFPPAFADQLPLPGTPAPRSAHYAESTISMSSAVSSPAIYPHSTPAPSFPPLPAAPAEFYDPVPLSLQHNVPHGYVAFDPRVPDLSVSGFMGGMQHPQAFSAPPPPPSLVGYAPPVSHAPLPSVSPVAHHHAVRPPSRAYTLPADLNLTPHELEQVQANIAPLEPYVAAERAHHDPRTGGNLPYLQQHALRQNSAPPFEHAPSATPPTPPRPCPSPLPSHRQLEDSAAMPPPPPRSRTPLRTPPPPAPSSHFRQSPSPSPSPVESTFAAALAPTASGLLETIGEDGESQAGTARSAMLPAGVADALKVSQNGDEDVRSVKAANSPGRNSVQDLEDFVEQEERRAEEARAASSPKSVEGAEAVEEKQLPPLPVRSQVEAVRPKAQDIFASRTADPTPTSPPLIPFPSSPSPSKPPKRDAGGLSALEARLARPVTPDLTALSLSSRSPSPIKPSRAHSPSLQAPNAAPTSALRARSISRASRYQEIQARVEQVEADPTEAVRQAVRKAPWAQQSTSPSIASSPQPEASATPAATKERPRPLTLTEPPQPSQPAISPSSPRRALPTPPSQAPTAVAALSQPTSSASSPPSAPVSPTKSSNRPVFATKKPLPEANPTESSPAAKKPSSASPWSSKAASPSLWKSARLQPQAAASPARTPSPASADAPVSPVSPVDVSGRKVVDVVEVKELKRDAVDRVAGWLRDSGSPGADVAPPPPQPEKTAFQSSSRNKRFTVDFGRPAPSPPSSVGTEEIRQEPTVAQLLAAESRAALRQIQQSAPSGLKPSSAVKKGLDGYLASLEHDARVSKDELAHKSAKATRPGKVKSVASIWAERVEEADREKTASPPPPKQHKPCKSMSSIQLSDAPSPAAKPLAPHNSATPSRARPASLQPSPVQDRSPPAAPFLNTTIGRPAPSSAPRSIRAPGASMTASESALTGLAASTGRSNKVASLLARYQQQIA